jgi:hypothetical protein
MTNITANPTNLTRAPQTKPRPSTLRQLRNRLTLFLLPLVLSGCTLSDWFGGKSPENLQLDDIPNFITAVIRYLAAFGGLVTFFVMIAGYQFLMSAGNEEGMTRAKDTIRYAAFGMVLLVSGYAIVRTVFALLATNAPTGIFK